MSNSGRKMSASGWCTFTLLSGALVLAFGALASATSQDKAQAAPAEKVAASTMPEQAAEAAEKLELSNSNQNSAATTLTDGAPVSKAERIRSLEQASLSDVASDGQRTAMGDTTGCATDNLTYDDGEWDGVNGTRPTAGWTDQGIVMDFFLPDPDGGGVGTSFTCAQVTFIDDGAPHTVWELRVYDLNDVDGSGGGDGTIAGMGSFAAAVPVCMSTYSTADATMTVTDTGHVAFGFPVKVYDGTGDYCDLGVGHYGFHIMFPGTAASNYWATAPDDGSESGAVWGPTLDLPSVLANQAFDFKIGGISIDCPNGVCGEGENNCNCPEDCGAEPCGNDTCCAAAGEDCATCPEDCGDCPTCGDGNCDPDEDCANCEADCGICILCDVCYTNCLGGETDCSSTHATPDDWITNVTFAGIASDTLSEACPCSYGNYMDIQADVVAGSTYDLTVTVCSEATWIQHVRAWFDWNGNLEFECDESVYLGEGIDPTLTVSVTVPAGTAPGCYAMRVIEAYATDPGCDAACTGSTYGETEDYTVCIAVPCNNNGVCDGDETCDYCPDECDVCFCGNGTCDQDEACDQCVDDCGVCPYCDDGVCDPDENPCNCPSDCDGPCNPNCISQLPNQVNGLFADIDCGGCATGIQVVADQFIMDDENAIGTLRFWGGYHPGDIEQNPDCFTIVFREDAGGVPGAAITQLDCVDATTRAQTGVILFGVHEYVYEIELDPEILGPGTFWVEIYNNTTGGDLQWFWETGDLDPVLGILGFAWSTTVPEEPWNPDAAYDLAFELDCVSLVCSPECEGDNECIEGACCGDGNVEGHEECDYGGCGTCPHDLGPPGPNGNVGPEDLGFLLGCWGPVVAGGGCECLDIGPPAPNGNIGPEDLGELLGAWGPCPVGFGDDQCSQADCQDNCECVDRGACCGVKGDPGACDEQLTAEECDTAGGSWLGDGSVCGDCPPAVCINGDGDCCLDNGTPGCDDAACCAVVCATDPICCSDGWDSLCALLADDLCAGGCPAPGDTCDTAIVVPSLPYSDLGDTTGMNNDYDAVCPYTGSTSPDAVYTYTPTQNVTVDVDLCGAGSCYDTKLIIYADSCTGAEIGCADDTCANPCSPYGSNLAGVALTAGTTYFFVVDGYGGDSGPYQIDITAATSCGDGVCSGSEDCCNCPDDCGDCVCGDGTCVGPCETTDNCLEDCPLSSCGNCDAGGVCDSQVGINMGVTQLCNDGQWLSLGFPFDGGGMVDTITMVNNTNSAGGDVYLMASAADCGGPDVTTILATICNGLDGTPTGVPHDITFAAVDTSGYDKVWVVAVFRSTFSFDVAFNSATNPTPESGYGNLTGAPDPAAWEDLDIYAFGACYCVELSGP